MAKDINKIKRQRAKEIIKKVKDAGFNISDQAIRRLSRSDLYLEETEEIINLVKSRKWIISGGDVETYIIKGRVPTAVICHEDKEEH